MSLPENTPGDTPVKPAEDKSESKAIELLQAEVRSLRIMFNIALLALIVLVASLFIFMFREKKLVRQRIAENVRYIAEYNSRMEPRLQELNSKLFAYSKLHTNFAPIYVKYFGATNIPVMPGAASSIPISPVPDLGTPSQLPPAR